MQKALGKDYRAFFPSKFPKRGGLKGTTKDLDGWVGCLCRGQRSFAPALQGEVALYLTPPRR